MNRTGIILVILLISGIFMSSCSLLSGIPSKRKQDTSVKSAQIETATSSGFGKTISDSVIAATIEGPDSSKLEEKEKAFSDAQGKEFNLALSDSLSKLEVSPDSLVGDSLSVTTADSLLSTSGQPKEREIIEAPIEYNSADSIAFTLDENGQMAHLFGEAKITYGDIELTAGYISIDFKKKEIFASGITDSTGTNEQKPHFKQGTEEFDCSSLRYNFETKKGFVQNVITKQQDGIVHSEKAKMVNRDVFCMVDGKYSICDAEHPHFYLHITKGKVVGKKAIITGRAYMVLADFPIYVPFLPYGYLPTNNKTYSSGVIIPSYGEEAQYGFFLRDGGFYWAASEYFDITIKGDIYSKGSWALKTNTSYRLRYKFSGSLGISTSQHVTGVLGIYQKKSKNFAVNWTHSQDAKANPNRTISASVNFATQGFDQLNEYTDYNKVMQNTKSSSISYQRTFPNTPFKLSMNIRATQSSSDTTVNLELPTFTLNMKTIEPFKKKNRVGNKKVWEDISFSYSTDFRNTIKVKEYELLTTPFSKWQKGIKHIIGIGLPSFKLLKHINVSPSISGGATWHFNFIERYWVDGYQTTNEENEKVWVPGHIEEVQKDGFRTTYSYSFGISTSTTLYGRYQMKNPNSKIKAIRHKINPNISFSMNPDFRKEFFGFYDYVQTDSLGSKRQYSHFEKTAYPYSAGGQSGSISFGLKNNLEMKIVDDKDTTKTDATKKIPILEDLSFNGSYNLFADSMKLSIITCNLRTKIGNFPLNINFIIDPYALDERGNHIDKFMWNEGRGLGRIGRLTNATTGFSYNFSSDKIKKKVEDKVKRKASHQNEDQLSANPEKKNNGYQAFSMPWSLNFNYSFNYSHQGLKPQINQNLNFSGNIDITPKWKANFNSSFNFKTKRLNSMSMGVSRNLHCWNMAFQFSPVGPSKFYMFTLNANSAMLKDIKIDKTNRNY